MCFQNGNKELLYLPKCLNIIHISSFLCIDIHFINYYEKRAVAEAQLAQQLLLMPEDPGSNAVISNFYRTINHFHFHLQKIRK